MTDMKFLGNTEKYASAMAPAYFALDELINREWKTDTCVKAGPDGAVEFRGFRGTYRLSWQGGDGVERSAEVVLH